ncbi:MAG: GNAT family N-acetyltransferase [Rhodoferax sp.]
MLSPDDIAAIERATLDAVCPAEAQEIPGWLLPYDPLPIGRAQSAVPLTHAALHLPTLLSIQARYQQQHRHTVFRLPEHLLDHALTRALHERGFWPDEPVHVQVAANHALRQLASPDGVLIQAQPDDRWASVYTADGFDPQDGANRVKLLSRSAHAVYAHISRDGQALAAGVGVISRGWLSIHGMRTRPEAQGMGLASKILSGLATHARGTERVFLQVEASNAVALGLYRKAGFATAWRYQYWRDHKHIAPHS